MHYFVLSTWPALLTWNTDELGRRHTGSSGAQGALCTQGAMRPLQVQRLFFKHVHKLRDLALANCGTVEKRDTLRKYLNLLEPEELKFLVTQQLR